MKSSLVLMMLRCWNPPSEGKATQKTTRGPTEVPTRIIMQTITRNSTTTVRTNAVLSSLLQILQNLSVVTLMQIKI